MQTDNFYCCRCDNRLRLELKDNSSHPEETPIKFKDYGNKIWKPDVILVNALKQEHNSFTNLDVLDEVYDDVSYYLNGTFRLFC